MPPDQLQNPFDTRPPAKQDTAGFLAALGDSEAAAAYRKAMGEEEGSTTNTLSPELTPEELARLQAITDRERGRELVELRKREYLEWAQEFELGDEDPQAWLDATFIFNPDGTVDVDGELDLSYRSLTRLPPALTRVNGNLNLDGNHLTSLKGLPQEIHGNLDLWDNRLTSLDGLPQKFHGLDLTHNYLTSLKGLPQEIHGYLLLTSNQLTSLDELQGKKIEGDLYLRAIPAQSIPEGIELVGRVVVLDGQTTLKRDAISKGYTVYVQ